MFKANVGKSIAVDSFTSGQETITNALKDMDSAKVALVFSSEEHNLEEVINGIKSASDIPFIGCTSSEAIVTNEGIISEPTGQTAAMVFSDADIRIGCGIADNEGNAREAGKKATIAAIKNSNCSIKPSYIYMLATPGDEENYLKGVQDVVGRIPVFGGSAADNEFEGKWKVFTNEKIVTNGCAVMLIYNKKGINAVFEVPYKETGISGVITKINDERTIAEIDNTPALIKFAEWTGFPLEHIKGINALDASVIYPFSVKDPINSVTLLRQPVFSKDDNTVIMSNNVAVGTGINLMHATGSDFVDCLEQSIDTLNNKSKGEIGAYLFFHCGKRKYVMTDDELLSMQKIMLDKTNGAPFICAFTFGEYGFNDHSANSCGSLMLSCVNIEK